MTADLEQYTCCGETYSAGDARADSSIDPVEALSMSDATCPFCGDEGASLSDAGEAAYERFLESYYGGEIASLDEIHQRSWREHQEVHQR